MRCLPQVNSFLFFFGLETGTKIIAVLHMITALSFTIMCGFLAEDFRANIGTVEDEDGLYSFWYPIAVAITCVSFAHTLLGALLLVGARKQRKCLILMWTLIMCVLWTAAAVFVIAVSLTAEGSKSGLDVFWSIVGALAFFGSLLYCIITVNSFYLYLRESQTLDEPASKPMYQ